VNGSIVCGVDGSPDSHRALGVAAQFARRLGAKLIVANVVAYVQRLRADGTLGGVRTADDGKAHRR
jgi:nucleotide-binding universal stress UspA family protein